MIACQGGKRVEFKRSLSLTVMAKGLVTGNFSGNPEKSQKGEEKPSKLQVVFASKFQLLVCKIVLFRVQHCA
jgi:hypothetical protein